MLNPFESNKKLSKSQRDKIEEIKEDALNLYDSIDHAGLIADPRCISTAKTKLEEAVMWAVKGVSNPPVK